MTLKLFKLTMGSIEKFAAAADKEEMHEKRAELDPSFEYTPVIIEEVTLPGYEITVHAIKTEPPAEKKTPTKKK